jgi:hypothetical protein
MDSVFKQYERHLKAVAKASKLNKPVVFDALAAAGLTRVTVDFYGEGDSGQIEAVTGYAGDVPANSPSTSLTLQRASQKASDPRTAVATLGDAIEYLERRKQARLSNGVLTNLVFHREGSPVAEFRKAWASACIAAGVGKFICPKCKAEGTERKCERCTRRTEYSGRIFHDLRRTAVRNLVRSGVPQSIAMKITGHKTASMFRRYDIANEDDLRQAIEAFGRYHASEGQKVVAIGGGQ